ncbi:AbrB/MazE/SpoVT family DNA-binding domain-containing protein [Nevskia sp.]|uniref:antitoxin n=1 Tax=Nevskia sp. TaxID=1929292 RepID=UPI0025F5446B|nr:AbrB/MazE/SpoVT family DNA-binding domain-containing protein [Nevskia sp.]
MQTRVFQSGNSLAVRIPKELAIVSASQDVEIERVGDSLVIRPIKRKKLAGLGNVLAGFSPDFMADGRDFHDEPDRDWGLTVHEPPALGEYRVKP